MATSKGQRIAIWVITIVMTVGTLGAYFIVLLEPKNNQQQQTELSDQLEDQMKAEQKVDSTARKVDGKVTELKVEDIKVGDGEAVKAGDTVRVHYKGTIAQNQKVFDSSYDRGQPETFPLSGVIKGWQEGMVGMKVGGKRILIIPANLAYGEQATAAVPANSDLVFEVELLAVNPPADKQ